MKVLFILLLCVSLCGACYAASIDWVTMTSALKNEHDVVVVFLKGNNGTAYSLSCNGEQPTCKFPAKGYTYELRDSDSDLYKCQNVELGIVGKPALGPYCMVGVN